jgi:hypothetical protein
MGGHNAHMEEIKYIHNFDIGGLKRKSPFGRSRHRQDVVEVDPREMDGHKDTGLGWVQLQVL